MTNLENNQQNIDLTTIIWNEFNTPKSRYFDDIYFSNDDAIAEAQYVFINGNDLYHRFLQCQQSTFTIGETGFGSGLSFLIAWQAFHQFRQHHPHHSLQNLHFYSVEKYPLSLSELHQIHHFIIKNNELSAFAKQLQQNWSHNTMQFVGGIVLNILFDDVSQFSSYLKNTDVQIDAWFFDGFSPQKNSDMWSSELFSALYQVTKRQGTFSTFSAAGFVRRNLLAAGFQVEKRKGFAQKREMLTGYK